MMDELFTFPIINIDGDNEEKKQKEKQKFGELLNKEDDEEQYDIVYGEAEYPYWNFIGVEDRWIPNSESLQKALAGKFDACLVRFLHVGQLLVPWSKKKFKSELQKFAEAYEAANPPKNQAQPQLRIMALSAEQFKKQMENEGDRPEE